MLILKRRFDYFPFTEQFVLRIPSTIHEEFAASVSGHILEQLRLISKRPDSSGEFTRDIQSGRSTTIIFDDSEYGKHDLDDQFRHKKVRYPGIVLKIIYSQKRSALAYLADDYILGSDGNIRVVIGLNIQHSGKEATLSVWRLQLVAKEDELRAE